MSIESARKFLQEVKENEKLRQELGDASSREERKEIAKLWGYSFTDEDFQAAREETLSDEDLQQVAGGGDCGYTHEGEAFTVPVPFE